MVPTATLTEAALAASEHCPVWRQWFSQQFEQPYFSALERTVADARCRTSVYPPNEDVFNAFASCPFDKVKVVVLGQDPYHQPGQAHGLSFSVAKGIKAPPSLRNIYKALAYDLTLFQAPEHGDLSAWARQGVLLLNTVLTVEQGRAHSHAKIGWQHFSDAVMQQLNKHPQPLVFLLWGKHAQQQGEKITAPHHLKLNSVHPSPLSAHRGFIQCQHFTQANAFLAAQGRSNIDWHAINDAPTQKQQRQHKLAF